MPSPAEELARRFFKVEDDDDDVPDVMKGLFSFSVRVPISMAIQIDALAAQAGLSRNGISNELFRVGISSLLAVLPDPIREEIQQEISEADPSNYI